MPPRIPIGRVTGFDSLVPKPTFQASASGLFPSMSSLDWFISAHRMELAQERAIVKIRGQVLIDQERFPDALKKIGARLASVEPR